MANGQQIAEANFNAYTLWLSTKADGDFRSMVGRGVLSREVIAKECGFAKSALSQNPRIRKALSDLENELRLRGVLPSVAGVDSGAADMPTRVSGTGRMDADSDRLRRLEQENAGLRAEVGELKLRLSKFTVLQEALSATGRIPR